jgi:ornithine carbamoyltransferase
LYRYDPAVLSASAVPASLKGRDFLRVNDWSTEELVLVLDLATRLKARQRERVPHRLLEGRTLGMIFQKPSTRTRVSFEVGMAQLGGTALYLAAGDLQLGRGETIEDTAKVLSRYLDGILIRTFAQADVDELADHADIPVINGLTDDFHPCQALADAMTIRERFETFDGVRVAYLGDGNNVCHSLMVACAKLGMSFVAAIPPGYEPSAEVVDWAEAAAAESGGSVDVTHDPREAATDADVLYTDVWTSMGQDEERERRLADLRDYQLDEALLELGSERVTVMHCLPAHYGEEVTKEVLHGPRSAAWDQAENRLHCQKGLLALVVR